ncbi:PEGA domain-containing protein [Planctomycetota bacterium]
MKKSNLYILAAAVLIVALTLAGCVERKLTINTRPPQATVILNDEEIGTSPVTVSFQWYGDYNVRVSKAGYETLITHRELEPPLHDKFPFDFFAQILNPKRIVDEYEWTFELEPLKQPARDELIQSAEELKNQL